MAKMVIDDDGVFFDLTGCDPQRRAPVNSTYAQTFSGVVRMSSSVLIDPDIPTNAGFYGFVRMLAPEGLVVNSTPPAPVVGGWETQTRADRCDVQGAGRRLCRTECQRARKP